MEQQMHCRGGSVGGAKFWILMLLIIGAGIFIATKLGPVFQTKWELEDKMNETMKRFVRLGHDGIFDELQVYVDEQHLGFKVYDNCKFEGEVDGPGTWTCTYEVNLGIPKYEKYVVTATATSSKIPNSSY